MTSIHEATPVPCEAFRVVLSFISSIIFHSFDLSCLRIVLMRLLPLIRIPPPPPSATVIELGAGLCPRVPLQVSLGQLALLSLAYFLFVCCLAA